MFYVPTGISWTEKFLKQLSLNLGLGSTEIASSAAIDQSRKGSDCLFYGLTEREAKPIFGGQN